MATGHRAAKPRRPKPRPPIDPALIDLDDDGEPIEVLSRRPTPLDIFLQSSSYVDQRVAVQELIRGIMAGKNAQRRMTIARQVAQTCLALVNEARN